MKFIKEISALATYPVRHPVLRNGKPLESCHFQGDDDLDTVHFGIFEDNELAGVASLFVGHHDLFDSDQQFQLRGMAVLEHHRKKGFGAQLVLHAENYAASKNGRLLWFNARIIAVPFYEKLGYSMIGEPFDIVDIGAHYVMFKILKAESNE